MTKRFLEVKEMHELTESEENMLLFADEREEDENEEDSDIDKGGKTQA